MRMNSLVVFLSLLGGILALARLGSSTGRSS